MSELTVVLAGGGSGGHIYPALAIAERLIEIKPGARAIFVCSERAIDRRILGAAGVDFRPVPARPLSWRPGRLGGFVKGMMLSRRLLDPLLRGEGVAAVIALGGFAAAPAVSAAAALRIPVTLVNLDAVPGKANRWLARRAARVLTATPLPKLPRFASEVTGMPVRRQALRQDNPRRCRERLGLDPNRPTLLVLGGSQGARSINRVLLALAAAAPRELDGWQVLHICGDETPGGEPIEPALRAAYAAGGVRAVIHPFIAEMGVAWGTADLAISRAGASSVAEAALNAVPTVFLPYPHHRDQHQRLNAEPLAACGAAVIVSDRVDPVRNLETLRPVLGALLGDAGRRDRMRHALGDGVAPDAALRIAQIVTDIGAGPGPIVDPVL